MSTHTLPERFHLRTTCRICPMNDTVKGFRMPQGLVPFLDLGIQPLADQFLDDPADHQDSFRLEVMYCMHCHLVQQMGIVRDDILFGEDYAFFTGASPSSLKYFQDYAVDVIKRFPILSDGLVVEIASNDGTLLGQFKDAGCTVLGIEPADPPAQQAMHDGIETLIKPFSMQVAREVEETLGKASLIMANNVVAHVDSLHDFFGGVSGLLTEDGVFIFEVQYFPELLFPGAFDHIYHEHRSFFSLLPLMKLARMHHLTIFDVQKADTQGGSIRVFATREEKTYRTTDRVEEMLNRERRLRLDKEQTYWGFQPRVTYVREKLVALLEDLKAQGKTVHGFGASAKGNTLLNTCGITTDLVEAIVDLTPYKIGKFTPGSRIPVVAPGDLPEPDYYLLLVWNYLPAVLEREQSFRERGGKFIVPIPTPIVI